MVRMIGGAHCRLIPFSRRVDNEPRRSLTSRRMLATSAPIVSSACHGSPRLARLTGWKRLA